MSNDTPWRPERYDDPKGGWVIRDRNGMLAAIGMTMSDAVYAARAASSHEALLRALKDLRRYVSELPLARNDRFVALNTQALQAIAAAETGHAIPSEDGIGDALDASSRWLSPRSVEA